MQDLASTPRVVLGAIGIGVRDLSKSRLLHTRLRDGRGAAVPPDYMDEVMVGFDVDGRPRGPRLVLMHWTDGSTRDYLGNPVRLSIQVPDAAAFAEQVRAAGYQVTREAQPGETTADLVGVVDDPDGYQIEFLQIRK